MTDIVIGSIYNAASWSSLSDFTTFGTPVASISGSNILFSGGDGSFNNGIRVAIGPYNFTNLKRFRIEADFIVAAGAGFGVGTIGKYQCDGQCAYNPSNGIVSLYWRGSLLGSAPTALTGTVAGDVVRLIYDFDDFIASVTAYNLTQKIGPVAFSKAYDYNISAPLLAPSTGNFSAFILGGDQKLKFLSVSSSAITGADVALVGDSKMAGCYAGTYQQTTYGLLQSTFRMIHLCGPSEGILDVQNKLPEIFAAGPKHVILAIGSNDVRANPGATGWTTAQQTTYAAVVTSLQTASITVSHLLPLQEASINQSALWTWLKTTYPGYTIDPNIQNFQLSEVLASDGVHPNVVGHNLIAPAISNYLKNVRSVPVKEGAPGNSRFWPHETWTTGSLTVPPGFPGETRESAGSVTASVSGETNLVASTPLLDSGVWLVEGFMGSVPIAGSIIGAQVQWVDVAVVPLNSGDDNVVSTNFPMGGATMPAGSRVFNSASPFTVNLYGLVTVNTSCTLNGTIRAIRLAPNAASPF